MHLARRYVMGSIKRITCHQFLTYQDLECTPGPHLNMVSIPIYREARCSGTHAWFAIRSSVLASATKSPT